MNYIDWKQFNEYIIQDIIQSIPKSFREKHVPKGPTTQMVIFSILDLYFNSLKRHKALKRFLWNRYKIELEYYILNINDE